MLLYHIWRSILAHQWEQGRNLSSAVTCLPLPCWDVHLPAWCTSSCHTHRYCCIFITSEPFSKIQDTFERFSMPICGHGKNSGILSYIVSTKISHKPCSKSHLYFLPDVRKACNRFPKFCHLSRHNSGSEAELTFIFNSSQTSDLLVNVYQTILQGEKVLICLHCLFLCCKDSHHGQFQAPSERTLKVELERDATSGFHKQVQWFSTPLRHLNWNTCNPHSFNQPVSPFRRSSRKDLFSTAHQHLCCLPLISTPCLTILSLLQARNTGFAWLPSHPICIFQKQNPKAWLSISLVTQWQPFYR